MRRSGLIRHEVPDGTIAAAERRTRVHVNGLAMVGFDLSILAVNCYLQGVRDMAETMIKRPELCMEDPVVVDYQI